jgi:hypothetical protein
MKNWANAVACGALLAAFAASVVATEADGQTQPQSGQSGAPQLPKGQMPVLGRPTKADDSMPLFNFDEYFPGKWTFEWNVPDSIFGAGGTITGSTVYKATSNGFYEAMTEASGPEGRFTTREVIAYQRDNRTVARWVSDSRGFEYLQSAKVGGDLGGYFNVYFESSPFTYKGKTLRIRNALRLLSPVQYRNVVTLSVDGGPFMNMSDPWWKKDLTAGTGR